MGEADPQARVDGETSESDLFARRDDPDALRQIVERYTPLSDRLAMRYRGRGEPLDDLKQVSSIGLLKAIERFDEDRAVKFATYATTTILGELRRHLRDKTWSVRVPRSLQERWLEVSRTSAELTHKHGRSPKVAEIAAAMDVSTEDVLEALDAGSAYTAGSLDMPVGDEGGAATIGDFLPDVDSNLANAGDRVSVAEQLQKLPERQRVILYLRFFDGLTQGEIADQIGISQMHVSRLLRRALETLKANLAEHEVG